MFNYALVSTVGMPALKNCRLKVAEMSLGQVLGFSLNLLPATPLINYAEYTLRGVGKGIVKYPTAIRYEVFSTAFGSCDRLCPESVGQEISLSLVLLFESVSPIAAMY